MNGVKSLYRLSPCRKPQSPAAWPARYSLRVGHLLNQFFSQPLIGPLYLRRDVNAQPAVGVLLAITCLIGCTFVPVPDPHPLTALPAMADVVHVPEAAGVILTLNRCAFAANQTQQQHAANQTPDRKSTRLNSSHSSVSRMPSSA